MGFVRLILVGVFTGIYVRKLSKLHQMEIEFEGIFKLKLHLTVFFNNKILEYETFKEKILDTKEF